MTKPLQQALNADAAKPLTPTSPLLAKHFCHQCGHTLEPDFVFCPRCGLRLEKEKTCGPGVLARFRSQASCKTLG